MRACEGCRRRKIKCDSATTNTWPCAACTRLKLHCVPPSVNYEKDSSVEPDNGIDTIGLHKASSYPDMSPSNPADFQHHTTNSRFGTIDTSVPASIHHGYVLWSNESVRADESQAKYTAIFSHDSRAFKGAT